MEITPVIEGEDVFSSSFIWKDSFYLLSNRNASNWAIYRTPLTILEPDNWKVLIPEGEGVITDFQIAEIFLVVHETPKATIVEKQAGHGIGKMREKLI